MKILYFAALRERIGIAEEDATPPPHIHTLGALADWLKERGGGYEAAFAEPALWRGAVDEAYAPAATPIAGAREIAFFPPVTGG